MAVPLPTMVLMLELMLMLPLPLSMRNLHALFFLRRRPKLCEETLGLFDHVDHRVLKVLETNGKVLLGKIGLVRDRRGRSARRWLQGRGQSCAPMAAGVAQLVNAAIARAADDAFVRRPFPRRLVSFGRKAVRAGRLSYAAFRSRRKLLGDFCHIAPIIGRYFIRQRRAISTPLERVEALDITLLLLVDPDSAGQQPALHFDAASRAVKRHPR